MACKLTRPPGQAVFEGKTGQTVEISVTSANPASMVRIMYAGEQDGEAPFQFRIQAGVNKLVIAALGVGQDQLMNIVEVDGATQCHLRKFFWSKTNFTTSLDIKGV